jgi:uncharacterized surface protein with fasciclin (FAS1) repeats
MMHNRTPDEVRRYNIFKLVVLLILLVLVSFLLFRETDTETLTTTDDEAAISEVEEPAIGSEATPSESQEPTSDVSEAVSQSEEAEGEDLAADGEEAEPDGEATEVAVAEAEIVAPRVHSPAPGAEMEAGTVLFSGSGAPASTIRIMVDGTEVGQTKVDGEGNWLWEGELEAGEPIIEIQTLDQDGNVIATTEPVAITVVAAAETFATPELILSEMNLYAGSVVLTGSGEPGQSVAVTVDGEEIAAVEVADDGSWSVPLDLEPGGAVASLQTLDQNGDVINEAGPFEISVQEAISPTVDLPAPDVYTGGMTLTGTGQPGTQVQLYANELVIGEATVDADGTYTLQVDLEAGRYNIDVAQLDTSNKPGVLVPALSLPVLALPAPSIVEDSNPPTMAAPELEEGSGKGTISGTADPGTTVIVRANGRIAGITTTGQDGNWSLNVDLGLGSFDLQVQVLDEDGNVALSSAKKTVEVSGETESAEAVEDVIGATATRGNFSALLTGLESAGLTGKLSEVEEAFTLFAPTDEAFAALPEEVIIAWNENPEAYREIMLYLVLDGVYTQEELAAAQVLTTLAGTNVGLTTVESSVLINNVPIVETIPAGNSIVHAIDQIILPPLGYQAQPPIIDISGVSIFTGDYLTVVGSAEPGKTILLQVSGENFGALATVDETGSWFASDNIDSGVHEIAAYMLDDNGTLMAVSQPVSLPVQ